MARYNKSHGMSNTRFYRIWNNMKNRCYYEKHPEFKYWGGKGIKCEWKIFEDFRDDMYESYLDHSKKEGENRTSIDRINGNKNYCKENCRWVTPYIQVENSKKNNGKRLIKFREIMEILKYLRKGFNGADIARIFGVHKNTINSNIRKYDLKQRANIRISG